MSDPITPKAEQHVVEGEFIQAEKSNHHAEPSEAKKSSTKQGKKLTPNKANSLVLTFVIMLVSGGALATAVATWLQLQPVLKSLATLSVPQPTETSLPMVEQALEKIGYQHNQLQQQGKVLDVQQAHIQQLEDNLAQVQAQLAEMQLRIIALSDDLQAFADTPVAISQPLLPEVTEELNSNSAPIIHIQDPNLRRDLNQIRSQLDAAIAQLNHGLQQLNAQSQQGLSQLNDYVNTEQWQQDKQQMEAQVNSLTSQLKDLASQQQLWIEKLQPQITQTLEDVTPQLEGFLSRFNQLFSIQKQTEQNEAAE
jgi:chromosome segregation ATPase